nr:hypothetical protein B0379.5 - Caenorhabditis elegans [Caenorhabditis elegans]
MTYAESTRSAVVYSSIVPPPRTPVGPPMLKDGVRKGSASQPLQPKNGANSLDYWSKSEDEKSGITCYYSRHNIQFPPPQRKMKPVKPNPVGRSTINGFTPSTSSPQNGLRYPPFPQNTPESVMSPPVGIYRNIPAMPRAKLTKDEKNGGKMNRDGGGENPKNVVWGGTSRKDDDTASTPLNSFSANVVVFQLLHQIFHLFHFYPSKTSIISRKPPHASDFPFLCAFQYFKKKTHNFSFTPKFANIFRFTNAAIKLVDRQQNRICPCQIIDVKIDNFETKNIIFPDIFFLAAHQKISSFSFLSRISTKKDDQNPRTVGFSDPFETSGATRFLAQRLSQRTMIYEHELFFKVLKDTIKPTNEQYKQQSSEWKTIYTNKYRTTHSAYHTGTLVSSENAQHWKEIVHLLKCFKKHVLLKVEISNFCIISIHKKSENIGINYEKIAEIVFFFWKSHFFFKFCN